MAVRGSRSLHDVYEILYLYLERQAADRPVSGPPLSGREEVLARAWDFITLVGDEKELDWALGAIAPGTLKGWKVCSIMVQALGEKAGANSCTACEKRLVPFGSCKTAGKLGRGCCGNCLWQNSTLRCSLNNDTEKAPAKLTKTATAKKRAVVAVADVRSSPHLPANEQDAGRALHDLVAAARAFLEEVDGLQKPSRDLRARFGAAAVYLHEAANFVDLPAHPSVAIAAPVPSPLVVAAARSLSPLSGSAPKKRPNDETRSLLEPECSKKKKRAHLPPPPSSSSSSSSGDLEIMELQLALAKAEKKKKKKARC